VPSAVEPHGKWSDIGVDGTGESWIAGIAELLSHARRRDRFEHLDCEREGGMTLSAIDLAVRPANTQGK